ncbi:uncharacterized protein B0T23DRAFT_401793 [Neurospora hispaniola]|uniref:Uncharacterized protein n=1 Tax=Neurospora hispaniola TaxID=588809 RepID=A0AAJ0MWG4_9PEZI|nr:hypothetical protein B0T23DRAFT_401793 [Neurospora hispaniola]
MGVQQGSGIDNSNNVHQHEPLRSDPMTMPIPPAAMWLRIRTRSRHQDTVQLPSDRRSETTFIIFSGSQGPRRYDKPSHPSVLHKLECRVLIMHNQLLQCRMGIRGTKNGTHTIMRIGLKATWTRSLEYALLFSAWSENELIVELRTSSSGSQWFRRIANELRPLS